MEEKTTPLEVLLERAQAYTTTSIQLFKLQATDKISKIISGLASGLVIFIIVVLLFVNLNIVIALLIGDLMGKIWMGFLAVSAIYAALGLLVYVFRDKWIKKPVSDQVITQLLKD